MPIINRGTCWIPFKILLLLTTFFLHKGAEAKRFQLDPDQVQDISRILVDHNKDDTLDLLGQQVTISGRATVGSSIMADPYLMIYVQDKTAGVMVFSKTFDRPINRGDSLIVSGTLELFKGTAEVIVDEYEIVDAPSRVPSSISLEKAFANPSRYPGMLVRGEAVITHLDFEGNPAMAEISPTEASDHSLYVFVSRSNVHYEDFNFDMMSVGDHIYVEGILDTYYSEFWETTLNEVLPRTPADVTYTNVPRQYLSILMWAGLAIIVLIGGWGIALRIQVKARTEELAQAVEEKELLMQEMHHRVKNNLTVISGILELQKHEPGESVEDLIEDTQSRIESIGQIHKKLYQSDTLSDIDMQDYIEEFTDTVMNTFNSSQKEIALTKNLQSFRLGILQAVPIGLIINELMSNAFKHGFSDTEQGEIKIDLIKEEEKVIVSVADNGQALPEDFSLDSSGSLGSTLIQSFTDQLNGTVEYTQNGWTRFTVTIPLEEQQ